MPRLARFDLDHTLLSGDTDVLRCEYLMQHGRLDRATFATTWLGEQGLLATLINAAIFYSESVNDRPLLHAVGEPVAVDANARPMAVAQALGWQVFRLNRES